MAAPTYNIIDELKEEGDRGILQKYSGFEFDDSAPKSTARENYENILYLERPGCNLCMGNQEKAEEGDTVLATSTRLFKGRVVEIPLTRRVSHCSHQRQLSFCLPFWAGRQLLMNTRLLSRAST